MRRRDVLFGLVLAGSLVANVYMLRARARSRQEAPATAPVVEPSTRAPLAPAPVTSAVPVPDAIKKLDRAALEERVRKAEAAVYALLPAEEQFDVSTGGPENEARARISIDRVFGVKGSEERPYDLECRGEVCRFQTERPASEWSDAIQVELLGVARDMAMGKDTAYFHVDPGDEAPGLAYEGRIANALWTSLALAACRHEHEAAGMVNFELRLVERHVEVETSGPLAAEPAGLCVRKAIEDLVAERPLPEDVTVLPKIPWWVPLP